LAVRHPFSQVGDAVAIDAVGQGAACCSGNQSRGKQPLGLWHLITKAARFPEGIYQGGDALKLR